MSFKYSLLIIPVAFVMMAAQADAQSGSRSMVPSVQSVMPSNSGSGTRVPVESFDQGTLTPAPMGSTTRNDTPAMSTAPMSNAPVYSSPIESYSAPVESYPTPMSVPSSSYVVPSASYAPACSYPSAISYPAAPTYSYPRYNTFRSGGWFGRRNNCGGY